MKVAHILHVHYFACVRVYAWLHVNACVSEWEDILWLRGKEKGRRVKGEAQRHGVDAGVGTK